MKKNIVKFHKIKSRFLIMSLSSLALIISPLSLIHTKNSDSQQNIENKNATNSSRMNYTANLDTSDSYLDSNYQSTTKLPYKAKKHDHLQMAVGMKDGFAYISENNQVIIMNLDGSLRKVVHFDFERMQRNLPNFKWEFYYLEYIVEADHLIVLEKLSESPFTHSSIVAHAIDSQGNWKSDYILKWVEAEEVYSYQVTTSYFINRFVFAKLGSSWFEIYNVNSNTGKISNHSKGDLNNHGSTNELKLGTSNYGIISALNFVNKNNVSYNIFLTFFYENYYTARRVAWVLVHDNGALIRNYGKWGNNPGKASYGRDGYAGVSFVFDREGSGIYNSHKWSVPQDLWNYLPFKIGISYNYEPQYRGWQDHQDGYLVEFTLSSAFTLPYFSDQKPVSYIATSKMRFKDKTKDIVGGYDFNDRKDSSGLVKYFNYESSWIRRIEPLANHGSKARIGRLVYNAPSAKIARKDQGASTGIWSEVQPTISYSSINFKHENQFKNKIRKFKAPLFNLDKVIENFDHPNLVDHYSIAGDPILLPSNNIEGFSGANKPFIITQDGLFYARMQYGGNNNFVAFASTSVFNDVSITLHKTVSALTEQEIKNLVLQNIKYKIVGEHATKINILTKKVFEQGQGGIVDFNKARIEIDFGLTNYLVQGQLQENYLRSKMVFNVTYANDMVRKINNLKINLSTNSVVQNNSAIIAKNQKVILTPSYTLFNIFENQLSFTWTWNGMVISSEKQLAINSFNETNTGYYTLKVKFRDLDIYSESSIYLNLKTSATDNQITNLLINSYVDEIETNDVALGQTLKLEASVNFLGSVDYSQLDFKWYFYSKENPSQRRLLSQKFSNNSNISQLVIDNFNKSNAGRYEVVLNYNNNIYLQTIIINYSTKNDKIISHLSIETNSTEVAYGSDIMLKANIVSFNIASNDLIYKWYELNGLNQYQEIINDNADQTVLNINSIKKSTIYKVVVSSRFDWNIEKEATITINLLTNSFPVLNSVELIASNLQPNLNSFLSITANIDYHNISNPSDITLKWYQDNVFLKQTDARENRLVINQFQPQNNGNYKVEVIYGSSVISSDVVRIILNNKNFEKFDSVNIAKSSSVVNENSDLELDAIINGSNLIEDNLTYKWYRTSLLDHANQPLFSNWHETTNKTYKVGKLSKAEFNDREELYFKLVVHYNSSNLVDEIILDKTITINWIDQGLNYIDLNGYTFIKDLGIEQEGNNLIAPYGSTVVVNPNIHYSINEQEKNKLSYKWYDSNQNLVSSQKELVLKNMTNKDFKKYYLEVKSSDQEIKIVGEPISFDLRINNKDDFKPHISLNSDVINIGNRFTLASSISNKEARKFLLIKNIDPSMVKVSVEADDFWGTLKIFYKIESNDAFAMQNNFSQWFMIENYFSIFWAIISLIIVASFIVVVVIFAAVINKKNKAKYMKNLKKYKMLRSWYILSKNKALAQQPKIINNKAIAPATKSNIKPNIQANKTTNKTLDVPNYNVIRLHNPNIIIKSLKHPNKEKKIAKT